MNSEASQNIDHAEREKFDSVASGWWDPEGPFRPLHELNPARLKFICDRATIADRDVLDVGCGGGILAESLARKGGNVTGIDIAPRVLSIARLHLHESGLDVDYQEKMVEDQAQEKPEGFDIVTCMEMLEHVPDPASVVNACAGMLTVGGHLFMSTLNRTPMSFAVAILGGEYITRIIPKGTHQYDRFIKPSELCSWLRSAGMKVEDISGIHYNPIERTARTGGHVNVNYLIHAVKSEE